MKLSKIKKEFIETLEAFYGISRMLANENAYAALKELTPPLDFDILDWDGKSEFRVRLYLPVGEDEVTSITQTERPYDIELEPENILNLRTAVKQFFPRSEHENLHKPSPFCYVEGKTVKRSRPETFNHPPSCEWPQQAYCPDMDYLAGVAQLKANIKEAEANGMYDLKDVFESALHALETHKPSKQMLECKEEIENELF